MIERYIYLGDSVYAHFPTHGQHVDLTLGHHQNAPIVSIEPRVLEALILFVRAHGWKVK